MNSIELMVLKGFTVIHGRTYEMYSGYLSPNDLIRFCEVPSFDPDMAHSDIAEGLKSPPINNWQRPLDVKRLQRIRENIDEAVVGTGDKDSLMANPVLIGKSDKAGRTGVSLDLTPYQLSIPNRSPATVNDVYKLKLTGALNDKPLWILDGQHRIHGLGESPYIVDSEGNNVPNGSIVAEQTIPVVFVIDSIYKPKFLAKIFTQVTTEAEPMDPLHGDWMQYAFDMGDYQQEIEKCAMATVIKLVTEQTIDGVANEFNESGGQIRFNPHMDINGVGSLKKNSTEFRKMISSRYFSHLVPRAGDELRSIEENRAAWSEELTISFVRFYRAAEEVDQFSLMGSRLMDPNQSFPKLATEFFSSFFEFLASNPDNHTNSQSDWVEFLGTTERQFDKCDWRLTTVSRGSTQTNRAYKSSSHAATVTFSKFFNSPLDFEGVDPATWLLGPGEIYIQSAPLSTRFPRSQYLSQTKPASGGTSRLNLRMEGHKMIRFKSIPHSQTTIVDVQRKNSGGNWESIRKDSAITLRGGQDSEPIKVITLCYSEDSEEVTEFTILS